MVRTLRLAVAQNTVPEDPTDVGALRASGAQIRDLMREAREAGARLVQFPEGAVTYPDKYVMSAEGPGSLSESDWDKAAWRELREEAEAIARLAGELGLWVAFGSLHPLTAPSRPHNSMYVVNDQGRLVTRYDKRFLSHSELTYMYTPGSEPVVFNIDGFRIGLALCIEAHFPEVFAEYERLDVDCVLLSVMVDDPARAVVAQAYGKLFSYWLGYAVPAQFSATVPSGIVAPGGRWLTRCPSNGRPAVSVADLDLDATDPDIDVAVRLARPWRRLARAGLYDERTSPEDPRSVTRTAF